MKNLFTIILVILGISQSFSQSNNCFVTVSPQDTMICIGDTIKVSAFPNIINNIKPNQEFNFNSSTIPQGWTSIGASSFGTPCGANPTGSPYFWALTGNTTPALSTAFFDVSCGGALIFDMIFATQNNPSPCEGPDEEDEGVSLQYSTNGTTWIDIVYYSPGGFELAQNPGNSSVSLLVPGQTTPYTSWATYTVPIPLGAMTSNTKFRWIQLYSSTTITPNLVYDSWGLDNVKVFATGAPCGLNSVVNWTNGLTDTTSFNTVITGDTTFQALVYDNFGVFQCSSPIINIKVNPDQLTYNLVDTVYSFCPSFAPTVAVTDFANSVPPYSVLWSIPSTNNPVTLVNSGLEQDTTTVYVTIFDGCNYQRQDSVVYIMNKKLDIDTMYSFPATCDPIGAVSGVIIGQTGVPNYNWSGPGANNPNFINASVWTDLASGWYYFVVKDDVCSDTDSVFVDILNPPIAAFSANPTSGCAPLTVTFINNSQNTNDYIWDFGNGNIVTTSSTNPQIQTITEPTNVTLIAFATPTCADTITSLINLAVCGCTDPSALNFNPSATSNDGSCLYQSPSINAPNVFSPNNDNSNDLFFIDATNYTNINLVITNRWGNIMFEAGGLNPTWDGKAQSGLDAAEGTYFYKYDITPLMGDNIIGHGFFQLIRNK